MSQAGAGGAGSASLSGPVRFGPNFSKKVRKHIDQIRNRGLVKEDIPAPAKGGIERVAEIVRDRVAQGGGRSTTYADCPAVAYEDGAVTYIIHPDGQFWTVSFKPMIKRTLQPEVWPVPEWHPDFGDSKLEFEHLRSFATALLAKMPEARVELEVSEPGLMNLTVQIPGGATAEVYSVVSPSSPGQRRYGLFFSPGAPDEHEVYEDILEDAVNHFADDPN